MKRMKYRSVFALAGLSVFLFTACEKETDNPIIGKEKQEYDVLEKFKRITFTSGSSTSSTNSGTGTFSSGSGSITFSNPSDNKGGVYFSSLEPQSPNFSGSSITTTNFTNPLDDGTDRFVIKGSRSDGTGGGSFTVDGESFDLDFGYCASQAVGGNTDLPDSSSVRVFVGIQGPFDNSDEEQDLKFIYVISFNDATTISSFDSYYNYIPDSMQLGAYVVYVKIDEMDNNQQAVYTYFGTSGSIGFNGNSVELTNVRVEEVINGEIFEEYSLSLSAKFECVDYEEHDDN
jgi:hypothetical protein